MQPVCLLILLSGMLAAEGQSPSASELVRTGLAARQQGNFNAAIADFRKALAIEPEMVEARVDLGDALAAAGQFAAAIEEDKRALATAPDKIAVRLNLGTAYYKSGDFSDARPQFETVHDARPHDLAPAILLGYTYNKLGREYATVDLLSSLEAGHESNMELEYALGYAEIQTGKWDEGARRMERVAAVTNSADAWVIAGTTWLNKRDMRLAAPDFEKAIALHSHLPGLYSMAGEARYALGDLAGAIAAYQIALRADPRDFTANLELGTMRLRDDDFDGARPLLELALQLQPGFPRARLEMAKLNDATGRLDEALTALEALVKDEPTWGLAHWELGNVYFKLNRGDDAKRERGIVQQLRVRAREAKAAAQN